MLPPECLHFFASFVRKELGILYTEENFFQLEAKLREAAKILGLEGPEELWKVAQLGFNRSLRQVVVDVIANHETSFFRDLKIFQALGKKVLPEVVKAIPPGGKLRLWSAACSFGQEPYSIAILLREMGKATHLPHVEILATDVSEEAVRRTKEGKFSQLEVQRGLTAASLVRHFTKDAQDYWTAKPELRQWIETRKHNLLHGPVAVGGFQIIFCRNVLIYQPVPVRTEVVRHLKGCLAEGGYLVLGASESLVGITDEFDFVDVDGAMFYRAKPRGSDKKAA